MRRRSKRLEELQRRVQGRRRSRRIEEQRYGGIRGKGKTRGTVLQELEGRGRRRRRRKERRGAEGSRSNREGGKAADMGDEEEEVEEEHFGSSSAVKDRLALAAIRAEVVACAVEVLVLAVRVEVATLKVDDLYLKEIIASKLMPIIEALHASHAKLCTLRIGLATHGEPRDLNGAAGLESLPRHIQTTIFASLPLRNILRLRTVCKSWNSLLRSPDLTQTGHLQEGWLVMSIDRAGVPFFKTFLAFNPSQQRFFPLPGPSHPLVAARLGYCAMLVTSPIHQGSVSLPMMCGAGGLLCCLVNELLVPQHEVSSPTLDRCFCSSCWWHVSRQFFEGAVFVFNPLTGAIHQLPPPPNLAPIRIPSKVSMHVHNGNHYHVSLIHNCHLHVEVYNSMTRSWKVASNRKEAQCSTLHSLMEGNIFHWEYDAGWIYFYSLAQDVWCKIAMSTASLQQLNQGTYPSYRYASFLQCSGKILLAAPLISENLRWFSQGFALWQLYTSAEEVTGVVLSSTPTPYHGPCRLYGHDASLHFSFTTNGTHILMTGSHCVAYDLVGNRWYTPPSYHSSHHSSSDYIGLSCFWPRLDADPFPHMMNGC